MRLLLILMLVSSSILSAQQSLTEVKRLAYGNPFNMANENFINMTNELDDNRTVSLLLFDVWKPMEVIGVDKEHVLIDSANYHIESDKILFVQYGGMYELYPEKLDHAIIGDTRFVSLTYEARKKTLARGYFEIILEGDYRLLRKRILDRQISNSSPLGLPAAKEEKIVLEETLYYQTSEERRPILVPRKKADFVKIFRRDRQRIIDYAKVNKISLKDQDDVVAIFQFYNSLED